MKLSEMAAILNMEYLHYPAVKLSEPLIKSWHDHFTNQDPKVFQAAFREAATKIINGFPPVPAQVSAVIKLSRTSIDAESVFEDLCLGARKGASEARAHEKYANNEPALRALNAIGGWDTIRLADLKTELPFRKREFIRVYNDSSEQTEALNLLGEDRYATITN